VTQFEALDEIEAALCSVLGCPVAEGLTKARARLKAVWASLGLDPPADTSLKWEIVSTGRARLQLRLGINAARALGVCDPAVETACRLGAWKHICAAAPGWFGPID
jgi:hypothetical protein